MNDFSFHLSVCMWWAMLSVIFLLSPYSPCIKRKKVIFCIFIYFYSTVVWGEGGSKVGIGPVELGTKTKGPHYPELCKSSETSALISHLPFFCFPDLISGYL